jgi:hypothetical protein
MNRIPFGQSAKGDSAGPKLRWHAFVPLSFWQNADEPYLFIFMTA